MRQAKPKKSVTQVFDITALTTIEGDCYTKEWESTNKTCVKCGNYEECMVGFLSNNFKKADKLKGTANAFFDELDWTLVPWEDIFEQILLNPGVITLKDLLDTAKTLSKCIDDKTVKLKVQGWLMSMDVIITDGKLYCNEG